MSAAPPSDDTLRADAVLPSDEVPIGMRPPQRVLPDGTDVLEPFVGAGVLDLTAVHVAAAISRAAPNASEGVLLAAALCVRALQFGHVCIDIASVSSTIVTDDSTVSDLTALSWPETANWAAELAGSSAVTSVDPLDAPATAAVHGGVIRPLVFDGTRVYLERYWRYERQIGDALLRDSGASRARPTVPRSGTPPDTDGRSSYLQIVDSMLDKHLGAAINADGRPNLQRRAGALTARHHVTVLAGGPGTGKTHTIARFLAAHLHAASKSGRALEIALAAPTGKAAARTGEAIGQAMSQLDLPTEVAEQLGDVESSTIHRLLGNLDGIRFRHDHNNPLPHDLVVIDETSMVALPLMARLLDALRPEAHLVLVGDPFQLASVEAGAVLGDVVGPAARSNTPVEGPLSERITVLARVHRYGEDSSIAALADAIRADDPDRTMEILSDPAMSEVSWVDTGDSASLAELQRSVVEDAATIAGHAINGDTDEALDQATALKVLCGTRFGEFGSHAWSNRIEAKLSTDAKIATTTQWYTGRPVMVTRNDYITGVFNGDTGLVVRHEGRPMVALPDGATTRYVPISRLEHVETWWAMTIHKSQGSEFDHVIVSLPDATSPILTNELLYTAVTRAKKKVTVVADEQAIRAAVSRRVARASGLGARLWP